MKLTHTLAVLAFAALPFAAQAGTQYSEPAKDIVPVVEPTPVFGIGSYWALQGGINAYQSYEGTERSGDFALEVREKIGGFGGLKFGHVFNDGAVRSALELDGFYNGADYDVELRENGSKIANATGRFDTGAILVNYLVRFDLGSFQPYLGGGIGGWFGQENDFRFDIPGKYSYRKGNNDWKGGFAWQLVAGADIFFNEGFSFFTEYKWLNYESTDFGTSSGRTGQHLVGIGLRWFF